MTFQAFIKYMVYNLKNFLKINISIRSQIYIDALWKRKFYFGIL
jgi:hypothetical protein